MKKFVFSLYALFEMKQAQKEQRQKEYAQAKDQLEQALREKDALDETYREENEKYEVKVKKGVTPGDIEAYAVYFRDLRGQITASACRVSRAKEEVGAKREALVAVFREVKSLEKLRERQYEDYLREEGRQETKLTEDILAFHVVEKTVKQTAF